MRIITGAILSTFSVGRINKLINPLDAAKTAAVQIIPSVKADIMLYFKTLFILLILFAPKFTEIIGCAA